MERVPRTFKIPTEVNQKMKELAALLKEDDTKVLVRAVNYLYENKKTVVEEDMKDRLSGLK